jgi:hypothetical protein
MDKYDTVDDKVNSKSDSLLNADDKKTVIDILSKANAISNQKAKYDKDNDLLVNSFKQCIEVLAIYRMIRELNSPVNIHRFKFIIDIIDLTCLEEAALRLAIARNDDTFRNAIEQFCTDMNKNRLKTTLKEVALSVIRDIRKKDDVDYDYIEYHDYLYEDSAEDEEEDDKV